MSELRIWIDATPLLLRSAGVKTYVYYWVQALRREAGEQAVRLFPLLGPPGPCVHDRSVNGWLATAAGLGWLHLANASPLRLLNLFAGGAQVFHASHQLLRPPGNCRVTATIYDMTCWLVPEMHAAANVRMARKFARRVMRQADGLIAISEHSKQDAVRILGLDPERIAVIYPGVAETFFSTPAPSSGKPYILFVGTVEPRKNLGVLLDAYERLPGAIRGEFDLVVAGSPGWGDPAVLQRLQVGMPGLRYLGYVPEERLPAWNAGASLFVYPSLYEGFGLPVAQAMAAGVPVVTSRVSSLPEVAGEAGVLVDPRSADELAEAIARVLDSPEQIRRLRAAGRARAERYRWSRCAVQSLEFFARVACGQPALAPGVVADVKSG
jgi:alpha-1,3-rhamnosyl/mannosyltransferase